MGEAVVTQGSAQLLPSLHDPDYPSGIVLPCDVPKSRNYGTNHHSAKDTGTMLIGKTIALHQDGVASIYLMHRPEITDDLTLSVSWIREHVELDLTADELEALAAKLTKAVKKMRKHQKKQAKQAKDAFVSLDTVSDYVLRGRRK